MNEQPHLEKNFTINAFWIRDAKGNMGFQSPSNTKTLHRNSIALTTFRLMGHVQYIAYTILMVFSAS